MDETIKVVKQAYFWIQFLKQFITPVSSPTSNAPEHVKKLSIVLTGVITTTKSKRDRKNVCEIDQHLTD